MRQHTSWLRRGFGAGLLGCALLALAGSAEADPEVAAAARAVVAPPAGPASCVAGEPGCAAKPLNVMCNDGTESPTCEVCRRGCCSHHGGCR